MAILFKAYMLLSDLAREQNCFLSCENGFVSCKNWTLTVQNCTPNMSDGMVFLSEDCISLFIFHSFFLLSVFLMICRFSSLFFPPFLVLFCVCQRFNHFSLCPVTQKSNRPRLNGKLSVYYLLSLTSITK